MKFKLEVKEFMSETSQTEGRSLQGLNLIRRLGTKVTKDVLFHELAIFNAVIYYALTKVLKGRIFQFLRDTKTSVRS